MLYVPGQRGIGEAIGQGFERTIPSAVQGLIQDRLAGLQRQQYEQSINQFLPKSISSLLSRAAPEERKFLWQNLDSLIRLMPQGQQGMPQAQQAAPGQQQVEQMMAQAQQAQQGMPQGAQALAQQQPEQMMTRQAQQQPQAPLFENPADKRARLQREISEKKLAIQERALEKKEKFFTDKETKETYDDTIKEFKNARDSDKRIGRMEELIEKGNFGIPLVNSFYKTLKHGIFGFGIDLTHLMTADAQEMEKLTLDFSKGAKDFFPGRVTDTDLKTYLSTLPNLSQTKAGMKRVINSMKAANEAVKLRYEAMKKIISENNGKRPADMALQIEDRIGSQLDDLADKFIKGPLVPEQLGGGLTNY